MKIYKVSYRYQAASEGYYFAASLKEAKANTSVDEKGVTHCEKEIVTIDVKPTKKGILKALNFHAAHNDNG